MAAKLTRIIGLISSPGSERPADKRQHVIEFRLRVVKMRAEPEVSGALAILAE